jgi:hypothetical protein
MYAEFFLLMIPRRELDETRTLFKNVTSWMALLNTTIGHNNSNISALYTTALYDVHWARIR